jgi:hypothetical protein
MRKVSALLFIACALPFPLAACGGSGSSTDVATTASPPATTVLPPVAKTPKAIYERRMQALGEQLAGALREIGDSNGSDPAVDAANLTSALPKLRSASRQLGAIKPPLAVRAEHEALRKAVIQFTDELQSGPIKQLRGGNIAAIDQINKLPGIKAMEKASDAIQKKGYKIVANH